MTYKKKFPLSSITVSVLALIWLFITIYPIIFLIQSSMKKNMEFFMHPVWDLPQTISFENYIKVFLNDFHLYFYNSVFITSLSLLLLLFVGSIASFGLARIQFPFRNLFYFIFIVGLTIPIHTTLIPVYTTTRTIGLYDSLFALLGPFIAYNLPITVFILVAFMEKIPLSLEESGYLEGATRWQMFQYIILPLCKPAMVTVGLINCVTLWNDFIFPLILLSSPENRPLTLALWDYQGQYATDIPTMMAALILTMLPLFLVYAVAKEKLMEGLIAGAIKG